MMTVVYYIFYYIAAALGALLGFVIQMLVVLIQYNDFVNNPVVVAGWMVVRDIANMLLVVSLLVMAFATILGVDSYSYKNKRLTKLLIGAILVNFSRTICGVLIDVGQVVMLTFVNGFKDAAESNLVAKLQMTQINIMKTAEADKTVLAGIAQTGSMFLTYFAACVFLLAALGIILIMTLFILKRIIKLWGIVIFSPLAFAMRDMPFHATQGYYKEWWKELTQQLIGGPLLAFFLWLSLATVDQLSFNAQSGADAVYQTSFMSLSTIMSLVMALAIMYLGVDYAQKLSGGSMPGAKALGPGAVVGGVMKGLYRRSGLEQRVTGARSALTQRSKDKEGLFQQRVALSTASYRGKLGGIDTAMGKAAALPGKGLSKLPGGAKVVGALGIGETARDLKEMGRLGKAAVGAQEKTDYENLQKRFDKKELENIRQGRVPESTERERLAATMAGIKDRSADMVGRTGEFREQMVAMGVAPETLKEFDDLRKKNYLDEAVSKDELRKEIDNNKFDVNAAPANQIGRVAGDLAVSKNAANLEKKFSEDPQKRDEYVKGIQRELEEGMEKSQQSGVPFQDETKLRAALMRTAGHETAYGISDGKFPDGAEGERMKGMFASQLRQKGSADALWKIKDSEIIDASSEQMKLTDVGQVVLANTNAGSLSSFVNKITNEGGPADQVETAKAIMAAVKNELGGMQLRGKMDAPAFKLYEGEPKVRESARESAMERIKGEYKSDSLRAQELSTADTTKMSGGSIEQGRELGNIQKAQAERLKQIRALEQEAASAGRNQERFAPPEVAAFESVKKALASDEKALGEIEEQIKKLKADSERISQISGIEMGAGQKKISIGANEERVKELETLKQGVQERIGTNKERAEKLPAPPPEPEERQTRRDRNERREGTAAPATPQEISVKVDASALQQAIPEAVGSAIRDSMREFAQRQDIGSREAVVDAIVKSNEEQVAALRDMKKALQDLNKDGDNSQVVRLLEAIDQRLSLGKR